MHLTSNLENGILLVGLSNPPVNCLSLGVRRELHEMLTVTALGRAVAAIVLYGCGKYFCAGGDLRERGTESASTAPRLSADLLPAIERCPKPVIAAIHGGAIGGGFELALACHYRVALSNARIALPEIRHGIIPLSGSIRLPRLWGVGNALTMILGSTILSAEDFCGSSVFDGLLTCADTLPDVQRQRVTELAVSFACEQVLPNADIGWHAARLVRHRAPADANPIESIANAIERHATRSLKPAESAVVAAIRAGFELPDFDAALAEAQRLFDGLVQDAPGVDPLDALRH